MGYEADVNNLCLITFIYIYIPYLSDLYIHTYIYIVGNLPKNGSTHPFQSLHHNFKMDMLKGNVTITHNRIVLSKLDIERKLSNLGKVGNETIFSFGL